VVNPYEHFTEWDPDGGAHLSDAAVRSLTTAREAEPGGKEL